MLKRLEDKEVYVMKFYNSFEHVMQSLLTSELQFKPGQDRLDIFFMIKCLLIIHGCEWLLELHYYFHMGKQ